MPYTSEPDECTYILPDYLTDLPTLRARGLRWMLTSGAFGPMHLNPGLYDKLEREALSVPCSHQIAIDVARTHPDVFDQPCVRTFVYSCIRKQSKSVDGVLAEVSSVLRTLQHYVPDPGYTQGFNFMVFFALLFLPRAHVFWLMVHYLSCMKPSNYFESSRCQGLVIDLKVAKANVNRLVPMLNTSVGPEGADLLLSALAPKLLISLGLPLLPLGPLLMLWDLYWAAPMDDTDDVGVDVAGTCPVLGGMRVKREARGVGDRDDTRIKNRGDTLTRYYESTCPLPPSIPWRRLFGMCRTYTADVQTLVKEVRDRETMADVMFPFLIEQPRKNLDVFVPKDEERSEDEEIQVRCFFTQLLSSVHHHVSIDDNHIEATSVSSGTSISTDAAVAAKDTNYAASVGKSNVGSDASNGAGTADALATSDILAVWSEAVWEALGVIEYEDMLRVTGTPGKIGTSGTVNNSAEARTRSYFPSYASDLCRDGACVLWLEDGICIGKAPVCSTNTVMVGGHTTANPDEGAIKGAVGAAGDVLMPAYLSARGRMVYQASRVGSAGASVVAGADETRENKGADEGDGGVRGGGSVESLTFGKPEIFPKSPSSRRDISLPTSSPSAKYVANLNESTISRLESRVCDGLSFTHGVIRGVIKLPPSGDLHLPMMTTIVNTVDTTTVPLHTTTPTTTSFSSTCLPISLLSPSVAWSLACAWLISPLNENTPLAFTLRPAEEAMISTHSATTINSTATSATTAAANTTANTATTIPTISGISKSENIGQIQNSGLQSSILNLPLNTATTLTDSTLEDSGDDVPSHVDSGDDSSSTPPSTSLLGTSTSASTSTPPHTTPLATLPTFFRLDATACAQEMGPLLTLAHPRACGYSPMDKGTHPWRGKVRERVTAILRAAVGQVERETRSGGSVEVMTRNVDELEAGRVGCVVEQDKVEESRGECGVALVDIGESDHVRNTTKRALTAPTRGSLPLSTLLSPAHIPLPLLSSLPLPRRVAYCADRVTVSLICSICAEYCYQHHGQLPAPPPYKLPPPLNPLPLLPPPPAHAHASTNNTSINTNSASTSACATATATPNGVTLHTPAMLSVLSQAVKEYHPYPDTQISTDANVQTTAADINADFNPNNSTLTTTAAGTALVPAAATHAPAVFTFAEEHTNTVTPTAAHTATHTAPHAITHAVKTDSTSSPLPSPSSAPALPLPSSSPVKKHPRAIINTRNIATHTPPPTLVPTAVPVPAPAAPGPVPVSAPSPTTPPLTAMAAPNAFTFPAQAAHTLMQTPLAPIPAPTSTHTNTNTSTNTTTLHNPLSATQQPSPHCLWRCICGSPVLTPSLPSASSYHNHDHYARTHTSSTSTSSPAPLRACLCLSLAVLQRRGVKIDVLGYELGDIMPVAHTHAHAHAQTHTPSSPSPSPPSRPAPLLATPCTAELMACVRAAISETQDDALDAPPPPSSAQHQPSSPSLSLVRSNSVSRSGSTSMSSRNTAPSRGALATSTTSDNTIAPLSGPFAWVTANIPRPTSLFSQRTHPALSHAFSNDTDMGMDAGGVWDNISYTLQHSPAMNLASHLQYTRIYTSQQLFNDTYTSREALYETEYVNTTPDCTVPCACGCACTPAACACNGCFTQLCARAVALSHTARTLVHSADPESNLTGSAHSGSHGHRHAHSTASFLLDGPLFAADDDSDSEDAASEPLPTLSVLARALTFTHGPVAVRMLTEEMTPVPVTATAPVPTLVWAASPVGAMVARQHAALATAATRTLNRVEVGAATMTDTATPRYGAGNGKYGTVAKDSRLGKSNSMFPNSNTGNSFLSTFSPFARKGPLLSSPEIPDIIPEIPSETCFSGTPSCTLCALRPPPSTRPPYRVQLSHIDAGLYRIACTVGIWDKQTLNSRTISQGRTNSQIRRGNETKPSRKDASSSSFFASIASIFTSDNDADIGTSTQAPPPPPLPVPLPHPTVVACYLKVLCAPFISSSTLLSHRGMCTPLPRSGIPPCRSQRVQLSLIAEALQPLQKLVPERAICLVTMFASWTYHAAFTRAQPKGQIEAETETGTQVKTQTIAAVAHDTAVSTAATPCEHYWLRFPTDNNALLSRAFTSAPVESIGGRPAVIYCCQQHASRFYTRDQTFSTLASSSSSASASATHPSPSTTPSAPYPSSGLSGGCLAVHDVLVCASVIHDLARRSGVLSLAHGTHAQTHGGRDTQSHTHTEMQRPRQRQTLTQTHVPTQGQTQAHVQSSAVENMSSAYNDRQSNSHTSSTGHSMVDSNSNAVDSTNGNTTTSTDVAMATATGVDNGSGVHIASTPHLTLSPSATTPTAATTTTTCTTTASPRREHSPPTKTVARIIDPHQHMHRIAVHEEYMVGKHTRMNMQLHEGYMAGIDTTARAGVGGVRGPEMGQAVLPTSPAVVVATITSPPVTAGKGSSLGVTATTAATVYTYDSEGDDDDNSGAGVDSDDGGVSFARYCDGGIECTRLYVCPEAHTLLTTENPEKDPEKHSESTLLPSKSFVGSRPAASSAHSHLPQPSLVASTSPSCVSSLHIAYPPIWDNTTVPTAIDAVLALCDAITLPDTSTTTTCNTCTHTNTDTNTNITISASTCSCSSSASSHSSPCTKLYSLTQFLILLSSALPLPAPSRIALLCHAFATPRAPFTIPGRTLAHILRILQMCVSTSAVPQPPSLIRAYRRTKAQVPSSPHVSSSISSSSAAPSAHVSSSSSDASASSHSPSQSTATACSDTSYHCTVLSNCGCVDDELVTDDWCSLTRAATAALADVHVADLLLRGIGAEIKEGSSPNLALVSERLRNVLECVEILSRKGDNCMERAHKILLMLSDMRNGLYTHTQLYKQSK